MGLNSTIDLGRQRFHRTDFHKLSFDRRLLEVIIASSDITPSEIWRTINLGGMGLIGIVMSKGFDLLAKLLFTIFFSLLGMLLFGNPAIWEFCLQPTYVLYFGFSPSERRHGFLLSSVCTCTDNIAISKLRSLLLSNLWGSSGNLYLQLQHTLDE